MPIHDHFWSEKKQFLFDSCKLAFRFQYYESWHGWQEDATAFQQELYLHKKSLNIDEALKDVFWDAVEYIIREHRHGERAFCERSLSYHMRQECRNRQIPSDAPEAPRILRQLKNFGSSQFLKNLISQRPADCLAHGELKYFLLDKIKVWGQLPIITLNHRFAEVTFLTSKSAVIPPHKLAFVTEFLMRHHNIDFKKIHFQQLPLQRCGCKPISLEFSLQSLFHYQNLILSSFPKMQSFAQEPQEEQTCIHLPTCRQCIYRKSCPHFKRFYVAHPSNPNRLKTVCQF